MLTPDDIKRIEKSGTYDLVAAQEIARLIADHRALVAALADMTMDRDSESKWAKQYCDEMVKAQQTAAHLEKVMDGMKAEIEQLKNENILISISRDQYRDAYFLGIPPKRIDVDAALKDAQKE